MSFCFILAISIMSFNTANGQVDTMKNLMDSIYNFKSNYIGKPLYKFIYDLKVPVDFADPDNVGTRVKGLAYYQEITMYLPNRPGIPLSGFEIKLAAPVTINLEEMRSMPWEKWAKLMTLLLGNVKVVSIDKFN